MPMLLPSDPAIAFRVQAHDPPGVEVRVNFGVFSGRHATPAEIERLAATLHGWFPSFAIVAEERYEFGTAMEAALHQVVVEIPAEHVSGDAEALALRVVGAAEAWANDCIASRHGGGEL